MIIKWAIISENKIKSQGGGGAVMRAGMVIRSNTVFYRSSNLVSSC